ncbi:D-alanyl-D-alanine carboxypeptidase/D-alanyl-D-alanine endopeptidase [Sphingomonas turrisvirgatae]|uniref:D-alanyl-D-alanine carboxypeptidase/D-alanyl-D-alanine-endopeptidase n=1 Tax=Sphingomonas turrisvirgatae TaxID=1888892 RepID=A0A1E3LU38_9SPHN|nr:D-alanyl-D-alanine carboxypeptidase/D-alanyl-D-alanine-endopeptidase [Sphingomonas turrisvirgatae]ODP37234.1 D-alanyl-D-alanine carboxypeptidase/D-alanyl-D-alanine-endopeptidase [Sphingomonas turrisvirgatae]
MLAAPATAQSAGGQRQVEAAIAQAPAGTRFGIVAVDEAGREIVAINPDQRFMPASNTKIVTTAAAYASLTGLDAPDLDGGAAVRRVGEDILLIGRGDARLSSAPDCVANCLSQLADAIAKKVSRVRHVIGDDTRFPDERWSAGMSWNNIPTRYGTAISALTLDDNEARIEVVPGAAGKPPVLTSIGYYTIVNDAVTGRAGGTTKIEFSRLPLDRTLRISGVIAADAKPQLLALGIDDPAHYAAWRLMALLRERGVKVGDVRTRHRPYVTLTDDPASPLALAPEPQAGEAIARLAPPPLAEDLRTINKVSQNLHAELLLRRLGLKDGSGSVAYGVAQIEKMFAAAGIARTTWDFSDGSGMSSYNRIAPRGMIALLRWIDAQPWGAAWRATLPVGGVDGTLARRFKGTPLEGKVFAKTGSLNQTNALAGYLIAKSGRTLTFAAFANDVPGDRSATPQMDAALLAVAVAN